MGNIKVAFFLYSNDLGRSWGHHGVISLARELNNFGFETRVVGYYGLAVLATERVAYSDLLGKISTMATSFAQAKPLKPLTVRLSYSNLIKFLLKHEIDIVFTTSVYPDLAEAAKRSNSRLVVWDLDSPSPSGDKVWSDIFKAADLILTYSRGGIRILEELGFDNVHWLPHLHDPNFFFPVDGMPKTCRLIFIGDYFWQSMKKKGLKIILQPLARKYEDQLIVHGRGWSHGPYGSSTLRKPIEWRRLNLAYNSARICLNIHRDAQTELDLSLNPRTFDIMGAGAFMLSDYVEGVEKMFDVGKDFVVSNNEKETLELVEYYLNNEEERNKIALSGHARVMRDHAAVRRAKELACLLEGLV